MALKGNLARNLLAQDPSRSVCHATAADNSNINETGAGRHHETADDYVGAIARLNATWRVVLCRDGIQWILQRRKKGGGDWPWRAMHYCQTRKALIRFTATLCGRVAPAALAILDALPEHIRGGAA